MFNFVVCAFWDLQYNKKFISTEGSDKYFKDNWLAGQLLKEIFKILKGKTNEAEVYNAI